LQNKPRDGQQVEPAQESPETGCGIIARHSDREPVRE